MILSLIELAVSAVVTLIKLYTLNTNILDLSRRFIALSLDLDSMMDQVWSYRVKLLLVLPDLSHSQYHDQLNFCSHQRFLKVIIIYIYTYYFNFIIDQQVYQNNLDS